MWAQPQKIFVWSAANAKVHLDRLHPTEEAAAWHSYRTYHQVQKYLAVQKERTNWGRTGASSGWLQWPKPRNQRREPCWNSCHEGATKFEEEGTTLVREQNWNSLIYVKFIRGEPIVSSSRSNPIIEESPEPKKEQTYELGPSKRTLLSRSVRKVKPNITYLALRCNLLHIFIAGVSWGPAITSGITFHALGPSNYQNNFYTILINY